MKKLISIFAFFFAFACADAQLYSITDSCSVLVIKNQTAGRSLTYPKNQLYADTTPGVLNLRTLGGTIVASWSSSQVSSLPASSIRNGYATVNYFLSYTCVHSTGQINPSATSPDTLYITDGRYLPDTSNTSNVSSANFFFAYWSQIDSIVYVDGEVNVKAKNTGVTTFNLSLPIPVSTYPFLSLSGLFNLYSSTNGGAIIEGVGNTAQFTYTATDTALDVISFHFRYVNQNPLPGKIVNAVANYWTKKGLSLYPTDTNANVGIGTAFPANRLQVNGNILFQSEINSTPTYFFNHDLGGFPVMGFCYGSNLGNGSAIVAGNLSPIGIQDSSIYIHTPNTLIISTNDIDFTSLAGFGLVIKSLAGGGGMTCTNTEGAITYGTDYRGSGMRFIVNGSDTVVQVRSDGIITQLPVGQPLVGESIIVSDTTGGINITNWGVSGWGLTGNAGTGGSGLSGTTDSSTYTAGAVTGKYLYSEFIAQNSTYSGQTGIVGFDMRDPINNYLANITCDPFNHIIINDENFAGDSSVILYLNNSSQSARFAFYNGYYNLPNTSPAMGQTMVSDGSNNLSWQNATISGATGSEPSTPYLGQFYFDTTLVKMKFWNGTTWAVITSVP